MLSSNLQVVPSKQAREEEEDAPLVISLDIGDCVVRRKLVDTGSIANILFRSKIAQIGIPEEKNPTLSSPLNRVYKMFCHFHRLCQLTRSCTQDYMVYRVLSC